MLKIFTKLIRATSVLLSIFFLLNSLFYLQPASAKELTAEGKATLEETISKGYSSKFCNAIGMGVSKKGAIKLSIVENSKPSFNPSLWLDLAFSGEEKFKELDQDRIVELAADKVIDQCGGAIGINDSNDIETFKFEFKSEAINQ